MAEVPSGSNPVSAMARSMPPQPGAVREIMVRQASAFFDKDIASLDREARVKKLDSRSWDLGVIRLERISLVRRSGRIHRRGTVRADDGSRGGHIRSVASAYLQHGSPPDMNCRILIASLDEEASEQILTAFLPRTVLGKPVLSPGREHMVALNSWQGAFLADHLLSLARVLPSIPKAHWPMLGAVTCTLVQSCLVPAPGNPARTDTSRATALRERLRCVVRRNMNSPDFDPEALRRLVAMSRSKLYRIFEGVGGVARFIQDERLDAARQRLADIGDRISIRALAGEVGFLEHSTFSRAFKLRYGSSPSEFREMVSAHHPLETRDHRHDVESMP
jgi:AraC-like DNA-binding protein